MDASPDAKILLSVRDSPDAWIKSVRETIFRGKMKNETQFFERQPYKFLIQKIPWMPTETDAMEEVVFKEIQKFSNNDQFRL